MKTAHHHCQCNSKKRTLLDSEHVPLFVLCSSFSTSFDQSLYENASERNIITIKIEALFSFFLQAIFGRCSTRSIIDIPENIVGGKRNSANYLVALLPHWSPFGDFGPHGDQNVFFSPHLVPIYFQSPHFLHFRLKNVSKVSAATI